MNLSTGDILIFAGASFISRMIALRTCSWWQLLTGEWDSHIGICASYHGKMLLFESTTLSDIPCEITGRIHRGSKAVDPVARIEFYDGKVWVMKPTKRIPHYEKQALRLKTSLVNMVGRPYEDLYKLAVVVTRFAKRHRYFREDTSKLFCSEMVGVALEDAGLIAQGNAAMFSPSSLARRLVREGTYQRRVAV